MLAGKEILLIAISYLLGCLTAGYYLVRWRTGADIRLSGSGCVGARNVGRVLGFPWFLATFTADCGKGYLAVWLCQYFGGGDFALMGVMLAVVLGHNWPAQLRFAGGKGVATSLGALLACAPAVAVGLGVVALSAMLLIRNFTLSGLFAFAMLPLLARGCELGDAKMVAMSLLAIVVLVAHRRNIREELARLQADREEKAAGAHAGRSRR